jgi:hypothetical protein
LEKDCSSLLTVLTGYGPKTLRCFAELSVDLVLRELCGWVECPDVSFIGFFGLFFEVSKGKSVENTGNPQKSAIIRLSWHFKLMGLNHDWGVRTECFFSPGRGPAGFGTQL